MGQIRGFLEIEKRDPAKEGVASRVRHFREFIQPLDPAEQARQAGRCMDCGVAFCEAGLFWTGGGKVAGKVASGATARPQLIGCPLKNLIPEFNELIYRGLWREAYERLSLTNPFPEFTGRVCPAPCEDACVCAIHGPSVGIKSNELAIIERAFAEGQVRPSRPARYSGRRVAIIGSGPAGLACAATLNSLGHQAVIFERDERPGGLLTYGIPDMKLEKSVVERRVELLRMSGVEIRTGENINSPERVDALLAEFDALVLCVGAGRAIDLDLPGRKLAGVGLAMDFLRENTRSLLNTGQPATSARGRDVLVIGSGDTSVDCVAVALRQGARSITRFERSPKKGEARTRPWPLNPGNFTTDYGLEEAIEIYGQDPRRYGRLTQEFLGEGKLSAVRAKNLATGEDETHPAGLALLAMGFSGVEEGVGAAFGLGADGAARLGGEDYRTGREGIFACGDARLGASLVVSAIKDGVECARVVAASLG